jgi:O-antigen ligase
VLRRAAPFVLSFGAVGALALAGGGYDPPAWGWAAIGLAWAAVAGLVLGERPALSSLERVALGALAAFVLWAAASLLWTASVPLTLLDAQRLLVLPLALAAFLALRGAGMLEGVAAASALASTWNLAARMGAGDEIGERAAPLGYGNAVGILAGIGLLLALGLARERPLWLAASAPTAAALVLSESRGAMLAVGAGAATVAALRSGAAPRLLPIALAGGAAVLAAAGLAGSDEREAYWGVAAAAAADRPLLGSGSGTWVRDWLVERDVLLPGRDAHSLYLETLAELGPVGLVLVLAALLVPLAAALRARERAGVPVAAGAYAAFVLHAGVDWDLELPAVALAGLVCGAFLLGAERVPRRAVPRAPAAALLGAVAVVAAVFLAGNSFVAAAARALRAGEPARAEERAATATRLAPWSAEAWRLRGEAQRELGDPGRAAASFRAGLEREPELHLAP